MSEAIRLRPITEADLEKIVRFEWDRDAIGELDWFGHRMDRARILERRWHDDGLIGDESSHLTVAVGDDGDECAGMVEWRPVGQTGNVEIGIALFPDYRGRGVGTQPQRLLVAYLFATTTVHRIQAGRSHEACPLPPARRCVSPPAA